MRYPCKECIIKSICKIPCSNANQLVLNGTRWFNYNLKWYCVFCGAESSIAYPNGLTTCSESNSINRKRYS